MHFKMKEIKVTVKESSPESAVGAQASAGESEICVWQEGPFSNDAAPPALLLCLQSKGLTSLGASLFP